ncbi:MAG: hypothetical protein GF313_06750 [Caldithrix sp.]|nr:hypothetical protein [Caldithrix sp.]
MLKKGGMLPMKSKNAHKDHFDCAEIEELAQKYIDGRLTDHEDKLFKEHLEYCVPCDKKLKFELQLKEFVQLKSKEEVPTEKLKRKLNKLFEELN